MFNIYCKACEKNKIYPLYRVKKSEAVLWTEDFDSFREIVNLTISNEIRAIKNNDPLFQISGFKWVSENMENYGTCRIPLLRVLRDTSAGELKDLFAFKQNYSLAIITLSDKGAQGLRKDASGPEISRILTNYMNISLEQDFLIPDEPPLLKALLLDLALNQKFDLICTTGGTGIGPRDFTPQVTDSLLDLDLPGFAQAMMAASMVETVNAILSRSRAGLIGHSLVINLPGSPKAVRCNLQAVLPALKHALEKAGGDTSDCGGN